MDAPRRERRHHRKAAAAGVAGSGGGGAAAARAAYGDAFGGPPRFAAPFGGAPADYAEVFGGVATTCSIPFLDLPPVASVGGDDGFFGCGGGGDYGEIFGRFDFGDFAVPYEELFGEAEAEGERWAEEIASSSGSSRLSIKKESSQLDAEPSICPQHFKEHESSPISFPLDSQQFVMSNNKTTQGRPDDLVEMTTCTVDPSMDYVSGSCNFSHVPATNHVSRMDNGTMANGDKGKKSPPSSASANVRSLESDFIVDQKQHIPASPPLSENISANENHQNSDSCSTPNSCSTPSNGTPSTDYAFLRVSDVNVQTQPKGPPPPLRQQPKLLNKRECTAKGDVHLVNRSCTPTSSVHATLSTNMPQADKRADAALFNTEVDPSSAAAAMKEAMEYAEARLRAAKELLERKGDSFKLWKKPSHHRSTRSTEIKAPVEVDTFEEKLSVKKPTKEEKNFEDSLLDKHQKVSAVTLDHCDDSGKRAQPLEKPQQMMQRCTEPCQTSSKLEKLGNWGSGDEFYELTGDDQKCKTDTATAVEDNCEITNPATMLSKDKKGRAEITAADSDLQRNEKLWEVNDGRDVGVTDDLREDNTASMEKDRVPIILEASTENVAHKEIHNSHFEGLVTGGNSKEIHDDGSVELPFMRQISSDPDFIKDMSSSFSEACSSGNHANDHKDLGNSSTRGGPVAGTSQEPKNSKGGLEAARDDEMQCTSGSSKKLQEPPEVANVGNSQASQIKSLILEELKGSYVSQAFPRGLSTAEPEAETYGREKFSFIDESFLHNENDKIIEVPSEALIAEEVEKVGTEEEVGPCAHSEEAVRDQDAECPAEDSDITSQNNNVADHEESTMLNVFEVASKLIKRDLDQEIQGSLGPGEVENRTEEVIDGLVADCRGKEEEETSAENSEKTGTEEGSAHGNQKDQTGSETDTNKGQSDVHAQGNITVNEMGSVIRSGDEITIKAANDCPTRITTNTKDEPASCSEMCTGMQHTSQTSNKNVSGVEKTEEVCKEAERELPTERSTTFEEEKNRVSKMEGKDPRERISKAELKHQQSHLEKSGSLPRSAEGPITVSAEVSKKEAPGVQWTKERGSITKTERERKDKEASRRLEEAKEREKRSEKERENTEERERKKIEEQERAREREKDRHAVERATREAHERAFAEARERAALERITAARQRASAEAREKEERANADATAERAAREARIKAERAAVERATAEARERAIEKAKAEKAAAERRERYRSSFKEGFKSTNLGIRQETQFQRATSSSFIRSVDSCSKVVEVESALRHKARLERHQRTAERVTKALAEKNMRDLLAQREQAEKHRLAEFMDPEVKRWSNGKEGNLRALLSTLQYILGADSGWQPVPLTDLITAAAVKKAYRKATLCVHPDKLQQRGATIRQKYVCEKVFDLLKDAWNKFTSEER